MPKKVKEDKHSSSGESSDEEVQPQKWVPTQLFVSGLPYETNEAQLKEFLGTEGIDNIKMPKYQDTGRCVGYAHVLFTTKKAYEAALNKNGEKLGQRYLDIKPAEGQKTLDRTETGKSYHRSYRFS